MYITNTACIEIVLYKQKNPLQNPNPKFYVISWLKTSRKVHLYRSYMQTWSYIQTILSYEVELVENSKYLI